MPLRSLFCLVFLVLVLPAGAVGQPAEAPDFLSDIKLGARLGGMLVHGEQTMLPIQERDPHFLGRPVSPEISFNVPLYGISAGLRFRGAELFGAYKTSLGPSPNTSLRWQSGDRAIPAYPDAHELSLRLQHLVFNWVGIGLQYRNRSTHITQVDEFSVGDASTSSMLFDYTRNYRTISLYVPARYGLTEKLNVDAELGFSLYGRGDDLYQMHFASRQEHLTEIDPDIIGSGVTDADVRGTDLSTQFGEVGLSYSVGGLPLRLGLTVRRLVVPAMTKTWLTGASLRFGLPF